MNLHASADQGCCAVHPETIVEGGWLEVNLPADTYLALHAAGRVPHPFVDGNEEACRWVADREWWWRTTFEAPPTSADERLYLEFGELDRFATIWLNGIQLGQTDNMFRAYRYDVTDLAHTKGGKEILIRFTPPSIMVANKLPLAWDISGTSIKTSKRNHMRKAQFGWGWDWGPNLPTVGVWRPVTIEVKPKTEIDTVRFTTISISDDALTRVEIDLKGEQCDNIELAVTLKSPDGLAVASATVASRGKFDVVSFIARPELWWTADLGEQPLYGAGSSTAPRRSHP